jgi:hypothetical protein
VALVVGTNTYISLANAEAYAVLREGTEEWCLLSNSDKEKSLISALDVLDALSYLGTVTSTSQALAWPRNIEYYDAKQGRFRAETNFTPSEVTFAQVELAMSIGMNGISKYSDPSASTPDEIAVGSISLKGLKEGPPLNTLNGVYAPAYIFDMINHLLTGSGNASGVGNPWWRAW